jgi:hypothetical protein
VPVPHLCLPPAAARPMHLVPPSPFPSRLCLPTSYIYAPSPCTVPLAMCCIPQPVPAPHPLCPCLCIGSHAPCALCQLPGLCTALTPLHPCPCSPVVILPTLHLPVRLASVLGQFPQPPSTLHPSLISNTSGGAPFFSLSCICIYN